MKLKLSSTVRAAMTPEVRAAFDAWEDDPDVPGRLVLQKSGGMFAGWLTLPGRPAIYLRYYKLSDVLMALAKAVAA